jgi:5-methylcytosine-specific restriction endonuclease McrA
MTPIDISAIYQRDNWVCQICGKRVNPNNKYPHPLSPSLDHIIPLSIGGTHEPRNVQLAHFRCNSLKSDNANNEQLRLFG